MDPKSKVQDNATFQSMSYYNNLSVTCEIIEPCLSIPEDLNVMSLVLVLIHLIMAKWTPFQIGLHFCLTLIHNHFD